MNGMDDNVLMKDFNVNIHEMNQHLQQIKQNNERIKQLNQDYSKATLTSKEQGNIYIFICKIL